MKASVVTLCLAALAASGFAQTAPPKIAIISIQNALVSTKDGQKAAAELNAKNQPKQKALEAKQNEINSLKDQLQKGENALSDSAKQDLMRQIDAKTKSFNREMEDAQAELEQDQQAVLRELGQKIMAVIDKYAKDNGYTLVLDVSNPQTPVIYASNTIDITKDIIELYDKNSGPATSSAPSPKPAAPPARSTTAPARPPTVPAPAPPK